MSLLYCVFGMYRASAVVLDGKQVRHSAPPRLLDLAALSARLSSKGFSAEVVLSTYQKMYEAQVVSYPRTEDKTITTEQFKELLGLVDRIAGVVTVGLFARRSADVLLLGTADGVRTMRRAQ